MTFTSEMQSFLAPLEALQKLIEKFDNRGVVIGGIASSLLGKTRLTADLDVMILLSINDIPDLIREAGKAGLEMRMNLHGRTAFSSFGIATVQQILILL